MGTVEIVADEQQLVGLGSDAEERLPVEWVRRRRRAQDAFVIALLVGLQLAWLAALGYAAYIFTS